MQAPPLLPSPALRRLLAVARFDGWSIIVAAGLGLLLALAQGARGFAGVSLLALFAGVAELQGRRLLLRGDPAGRGWLVGVQAVLLALVWAYAWYRWQHFDAMGFWHQLPAPIQSQLSLQMALAGLDPEFDRVVLLELTNRLTCATLAFVTLLYQGGMILYYRRSARVGA
jgi:hypothetical protein